ncbi:MAG TPA: NAD(P)-dependent oxidoreductase [Woeseiaceae bacterium]|nr:NAD(P)-dependent oxidoreductase [Woeseiaceae bacterium]
MSARAPTERVPDVRPGRLSAAEIERNFNDLHPPLSRPEALIEADRCYFCFDAPCTTACPTGIDIPGFIQKIRSDNIKGSAHTILEQNIMGGMCARVCPTEVLCEEACVRNTHEDKPVNIGLLQRYATDPVLDANVVLFSRAAPSGCKVAVVGAGPAGLSCAHRLAMLGHDVVVFNRDAKPGGLNEYGIAAYKTVDDFAQREVDYILGIGGIEVVNEVVYGKDATLAMLREEFDAVFLGVGLAGSNELGIENEDVDGVLNAIDYIRELRQAKDKGSLPVGRRVVVIGGGMTAIDIAVQSKLLGAESVDLVYRRGPEEMGASRFEQELAQTNGVQIRHWAKPSRVLADDRVLGVEFERTVSDAQGKLNGTGEFWALEADVVFKAVGQKLAFEAGADNVLLQRDQGKLIVDEERRTSLPGVWAGGDCVADGDDLTVTAVQHGKLAAISIDRYLRGADAGVGS